MALLTTILFTREWIGDAVPFLVVLIAALAFTPLGGLVADKVNESSSRANSRRYRPPEMYYRQDSPSSGYSRGPSRTVESDADHINAIYRQYNMQGTQGGQTHADVSTEAVVTSQSTHNSAAATAGSAKREVSGSSDAMVGKQIESNKQGLDRECEAVEPVEVLMPRDYEYLQRQRQRLERRSQANRAQQGRQRVPSGSAKPQNEQAAWWATERPGHVEFPQGEVRRNSVKRGPVSPTVGVRARPSGAAQSWGAPAATSRKNAVANRRMNARDLASAHEQGRMGRFDSWSSTGLKFVGPRGGLLRWMFGAKARSRVMDTVSASRRPVVGALLRVFPFLRSWGGFM